MKVVIVGHQDRIYKMSFAKIYPLYVSKATKKGRTKVEVETIIQWFTGYDKKELERHLTMETDFKSFISEAPDLNPNRNLITGIICGIRVENIEEPIMKEIRYLDKMIDELAKGKALSKILRHLLYKFKFE